MEAPPKALKNRVPAKPPPPPIIVKMQALNEQMTMLVQNLKDKQLEAARSKAQSIHSLAQSIHIESDKRPGYGADFAILVADLRAAAKAMPRAAGQGGDAAAKALRHLHDQCLRCHDQAPAAAGAGVCQLAD